MRSELALTDDEKEFIIRALNSYAYRAHVYRDPKDIRKRINECHRLEDIIKRSM